MKAFLSSAFAPVVSLVAFSFVALSVGLAGTAHAADRGSVDSEKLTVNGRQVTSAARISRGVAYVRVDSLTSALGTSRSGAGSLVVDGSKLVATAGSNAVRGSSTLSTGVVTLDGASYVPWTDVVKAAGGSLSGTAASGGSQAATVATSCPTCIVDPAFIIDPLFIIDPGF